MKNATIKSIRESGTSMTYPNGCWEVVIEFETQQDHPNMWEGCGLGDLGNCKHYQGISGQGLKWSGVLAYFDGKPNIA